MMKRMHTYISALLVCLLMLCGCQSAPEASDASGKHGDAETVSVETEKAVILVDSRNFTQKNAVLELAEQLYGEINVELVALPDEAEARETQLTALRVELMAGGGPDAFILTTYVPGNMLRDGSTQLEPLFPDVERAMRNGLFLPLDDLIAESEYLKPEEHHEVILNAGKTDEGQLVLPLLYSYSMFFVDKAQLQDPNMQPESWDALLNCGDEKLRSFLKSRSVSWFGAQYTRLADYDEEALLLEPETLENDLCTLDEIPYPEQDSAPFELANAHTFNEAALHAYVTGGESAYALPVVNTDGGLTAFITSFAAISRNAKQPEAAFKFIELLFSDAVQSDEGLYIESAGRSFGASARPSPVLLNTGCGVATGKEAYLDAESALLQEWGEKTNAVRFYSNLDYALYETLLNGLGAPERDAHAAEDICRKLEMMLAE